MEHIPLLGKVWTLTLFHAIKNLGSSDGRKAPQQCIIEHQSRCLCNTELLKTETKTVGVAMQHDVIALNKNSYWNIALSSKVACELNFQCRLIRDKENEAVQEASTYETFISRSKLQACVIVPLSLYLHSFKIIHSWACSTHLQTNFLLLQ